MSTAEGDIAKTAVKSFGESRRTPAQTAIAPAQTAIAPAQPAIAAAFQALNLSANNKRKADASISPHQRLLSAGGSTPHE